MNKQRLTAALELVGVLAERFPACFAVNPKYRQPLKLGIHVDILTQLSDTIAPRDLSAALRIYVSNSKYLKALVAGADRVDLNGIRPARSPPSMPTSLKLSTSSGATNTKPSKNN
jgi:ProP effector